MSNGYVRQYRYITNITTGTQVTLQDGILVRIIHGLKATSGVYYLRDGRDTNAPIITGVNGAAAETDFEVHTEFRSGLYFDPTTGPIAGAISITIVFDVPRDVDSSELPDE